MNYRQSLRAVVLAGLALVGGGCGVAPPAAGFEQSLTKPSGCADVVLVASNADDSLAVVFQSSGQVAAAQKAGKPTAFPLTLPAAGVSVHLLQGKGLSLAYCSDYHVAGETRVDSDRTAQSGSATLSITPSPNADQATLQLQNLMFQDTSGGAPIALPQLQISGVHVGWFAG